MRRQVILKIITLALVAGAGVGCSKSIGATKPNKPVAGQTVDERLYRIETMLYEKLEKESRAEKALVDFQSCLDRCDDTNPYPTMPEELQSLTCRGEECEEARDAFWIKARPLEKARHKCTESCGKAPAGHQWEC